MKKIAIYLVIASLGIFVFPVVVSAVQSGGGYIIYDQINNSPSTSSGNGFNNNSGGNPTSSQIMSGGGYSSSGGAYRNSTVTPTPTPTPAPTPSVSGGGRRPTPTPTPTPTQTPTPTPVSTPVSIPPGGPLTFQPNDILVFNPIAGQPQNININQNAGAVSIGNVLVEKPALFDIIVEPIKQRYQSINALFLNGLTFIALVVLGILFFVVRRKPHKSNTGKSIITKPPTPPTTPTPIDKTLQNRT